MITQDELQYKIDEVSVIQKDLKEVEGKLKLVLSSGRNEYQVPLLKRHRANLLVYLEDLSGEILEMRESLGEDVEMTEDELEIALSQNVGEEGRDETNLERILFGKNDNLCSLYIEFLVDHGSLYFGV